MVITSEEEYEKAMAELEELFQIGFSNLNESEERRLDELSDAIAKWEILHDDFD